MFEEANNFADVLRGSLPYCLLVALPVFILISSNPVIASSEFRVHRMAQFDVNGVPYGCRASALSLEAKSKYSWNTSRHCVVARLQDISVDEFNEMRQKAGGLVVLLPKDVHALSIEEKEHLNLLEQAAFAQTVNLPIYFSQYNSELEGIIADITHTTRDNAVASDGINTKNTVKVDQQRNSALSDLIDSISANGYQVTVSGASHMSNKQSRSPVIQGELVPNRFIVKQINSNIGEGDFSSNFPTVIVVAHLNTFGLYNDYPLNSDAAILLSLIEIFSKLYGMPNATPKYRIIFLLTESGALLNFQGAKKWLDENVALQNVDFVLCLDTIAQGLSYEEDSTLYLHVSKPPKEASSINTFFKLLKLSASQNDDKVVIEGVHKKINLAETQLAWEHERFSMKRFPAFTLSSVKNPKHPIRTTIFKDNSTRILTQTRRQANIIAEALARYIYKIGPNENVLNGDLNFNENFIKTYLDVKSVLINNDVKDAFEKYLKNVKLIYDKPDVREPDFMFYDGQDAKLNVYHVKPAVFDLFLTILICAYLTTAYFVVHYFSHFYALICKISKGHMAHPANGNYVERNKVKVN